ncbi:FAD:protein FMN transferase, partial [Singulisphaera rosea]
VIAPDGGTADSLDTAIYMLGPDRGLPLVESTPGAFALIVRLTPQGEKVYESRNLKTLPAATPPR